MRKGFTNQKRNHRSINLEIIRLDDPIAIDAKK